MIVYPEMQSDMETKLSLITKHITEDSEVKLTSLAHLLNKRSLIESFYMLKKDKAPGIDGVTFQEYETNLDENINNLVARMKKQAYKPLPVLRVYIPKGEGKRRPLGLPALEDKIVQKGMTRILNAIYEPIFLDCSYGFRTGRNCHQALNALDTAIMTKPVNHVIDADIKGFFDHVDHAWLKRMLEEKIADKNFLRLIMRFLKAGVMEEGKWYDTEEGTPQGGLISPVLANVYLHYVLDLWVEKGLAQQCTGYVKVVRYCDDFVILVQYKHEAQKILEVLEERMNKFGLELAPDKTNLLEFGRYARINAEKKSKKPDTFDFLSFTHYSDKTRSGKFKVGRKTKRKKLSTKAKELNLWMKRTRNQEKLKDWWETLAAKLRGHYQYYGVSGNYPALTSYYKLAIRLAHKWVNRRSQKNSMNWKEFQAYLQTFPLPKPRICHNLYTL